MSLIQLASAQGSNAGRRAGCGIVGGDVVLSLCAVTLVSLGAALPSRVFSGMQIVSAVSLRALGLLLVLRPKVTGAMGRDVARPGRTFLLLTALVTHHGTVAAVLRGPKAQDFLQDVDGASKQECQDLMARLTGNYKRGNEREARNHPRSR